MLFTFLSNPCRMYNCSLQRNLFRHYSIRIRSNHFRSPTVLCSNRQGEDEKILRYRPILARRFLFSTDSSNENQLNPDQSSNDSSQPDETLGRKDWFANRYKDTSYHAQDGMDPKQWALVYRVSDEQQQDKRQYVLYAIAIGGIAFGITLMIHAYSERTNPFAIGPGLILMGFFAVMYAFRFRKYAVLRIYSLKDAQEQWEHWFMILKTKPRGEQFNVMPPLRRYKIVWKDIWHKKYIFEYNSHESSDSVERMSPFARALNGNFMVKGRPWAVHQEFFEEGQDYYLVRQR